MRRRFLFLAILGLVIPAAGLVATHVAQARQAPTMCRQHFSDGTLPDITAEIRPGTRLLCYSAFAVLHSAQTRTPVWSAEHLTPERLTAAEALTRPTPGPFHAEPRLPPGRRAELSDYLHSGFDRGHMSPNGDMPTRTAQTDSFSLANMIPQDPCNNEVLWEGLESAVRKMVQAGAEAYVVTGPIYQIDPPEQIGAGVSVPSHIFKAVLNPATGAAAAYVVQNSDPSPVQQVSVAELEGMTGIVVFPGLTDAQRQAKATLPPPEAPSHRCRLHH